MQGTLAKDMQTRGTRGSTPPVLAGRPVICTGSARHSGRGKVRPVWDPRETPHLIVLERVIRPKAARLAAAENNVARRGNQ